MRNEETIGHSKDIREIVKYIASSNIIGKQQERPNKTFDNALNNLNLECQSHRETLDIVCKGVCYVVTSSLSSRN